jgi:hypothetical protein
LMHQDSNPLSTAISASMITITPPIHWLWKNSGVR